MARILTMQNQAITPVQNADRTLAKTDHWPQTQRDDLNNASMIQRQVGSRFTNRDEGLTARIRRMLERPFGSVRWREDTPDPAASAPKAMPPMAIP